MQDRNIIGAATTMALMPFINFYQALTPYILLAIVLIVVDSRFGVEAARKRGEAIRQSRKWRRAINKLVDYICWITLAGAFSKAYNELLGIPRLSGLALLIVYGVELASCFNNFFEIKDIPFRISFSALFSLIFRKISKSDIDITETKTKL